MWSDNWVLDITNGHLTPSVGVAIDRLHMVVTIIDLELRTWRSEAVDALFPRPTRMRYLGSMWETRLDSLIWLAVKNGAYSVKSGYRLVHIRLNQVIGGCIILIIDGRLIAFILPLH